MGSQWGYNGVTMVLQWGEMVLQWCRNTVTMSVTVPCRSV
jgi:hypothetical protein